MIDIQHDREACKAVVTVDDRLFTEYRYGHYTCRPYFYPVLTPDGQHLTRGYPMEEHEGETADHYHHRSIYVAHGLVNGYNLWDEGIGGEGHGTMLQRGEPVVGMVGETAQIDGIVDWFSPTGHRLFEERRSVWITPGDDAVRVVDHRSELRASHGDVVLGDTKEGGLFSIRVATSMDAKEKGRIENSEGQVFDGQGEETTWGKQAAWVDYSGPVANGDQWGFTVVDHHSNPRHPTYWHVRGYGLFTANPFGVHDFKGDKSIDESMTVKDGAAAIFQYRMIVHSGRGVDGHASVRGLIDAYQNTAD
ncbi:MAG: PmoA family protein [Candidatus Latescibacterota bacterium]|nr:PmoA family protein [Candidatus Latescibacterota bacterium]